MDLDRIEKLILLMQQYDLGELQVKEKDWEFSASRGAKPQSIVMTAPPMAAHSASSPSGPSPAALAAPAASNLKEVTSPIVGTFYRAPAPDQAPYKQVGDHVSPEDVICIVEAMKVMNEIKSGVSGTVRKIMVENQTPVEYGQPLFLVEPG